MIGLPCGELDDCDDMLSRVERDGQTDTHNIYINIARHHSNADAKATRPTVVRIMPPSGLQILPKIYLPKISSTSSLFLSRTHDKRTRQKHKNKSNGNTNKNTKKTNCEPKKNYLNSYKHLKTKRSRLRSFL